MNLINNYNSINKNNNLIIQKKIINLFKKDYLVRQNKINKNIKYIHKTDSINSVYNTNLKKNHIGYSIFYSLFLFKHKLNSFLQIKTTLTFICTNQIKINKKKLKAFELILKKKKEIILLSPKRGGFLGFYIGLFGFIPKKDVRNILFFLYNKELKKNLNSLYYTSFLQTVRTKLLVVKVPVVVKKFSIKINGEYSENFKLIFICDNTIK
jgi:hypothetical protein